MSSAKCISGEPAQDSPERGKINPLSDRIGRHGNRVSSGKVKEVCKNSELEIVHGKEIDYFDYIVIDAKYIESAKKELDEIGIGNLDFNDAKEDLFLETDETPLTLDFEV